MLQDADAQHAVANNGVKNDAGVKTEDAEQAVGPTAREEPAGRGQKRKRKGRDKQASQPIKSYTTRERAKAEAEVVAEVRYAFTLGYNTFHSTCLVHRVDPVCTDACCVHGL